MPRRSMSRRYLAFDAWPSGDRAAWMAAIAKGDILDGQGPAAHWADATKRTNLQHYSRWLRFLAAEACLREDLRPEERVTPDAVRAYVLRLQAEIAPRTVVSALVGLKVVIKAMAPHAQLALAGRCLQRAEPALLAKQGQAAAHAPDRRDLCCRARGARPAKQDRAAPTHRPGGLSGHADAGDPGRSAGAPQEPCGNPHRRSSGATRGRAFADFPR